MFGFQRVKLIINANPDFKIINMPPMNNFKIILGGHQPKDSDIDLMLEAEGQTKEEIFEKLQQQLKNLKLYLNLYSDNTVDAIQHNSHEIFSDKNECEKTLLDSLDTLEDTKLPSYLNKQSTQQHILLQTALDELRNEDLFNAFPKLINWLDDNDGKGSSRFCYIRDSCDHGVLDRTIQNVNYKFPDEFEFEDNTLKRNSPKNIASMKKYIPEVLTHVKQVFKREYVN